MGTICKAKAKKRTGQQAAGHEHSEGGVSPGAEQARWMVWVDNTQAVAEAVQRATARIGLDPARYGGHSPRVGMAAAAAQAGRSLVVGRYVRHGSLYVDNAAAKLGL